MTLPQICLRRRQLYREQFWNREVRGGNGAQIQKELAKLADLEDQLFGKCFSSPIR
jgi:hypothetical protein